MGKLDELMKASRDIATESMARPATTPKSYAAAAAAPALDRLEGVSRSKSAAEIPLSKIGPDPDQPREEFEPESLARLAESMRGRGQLQPIRVRWDEGRSQYVIVCGERRWRAAELAEMTTMSAIIMDGPISPGELLAIQVVENALREDLRPVEQARAFRVLMDLNGWSTHQVARELAVDQSSVVRALALLELPPPVIGHVERGELAPSVAYEVSKLDDPGLQAEVAGRAVAEGMNRAEVVRAVRERSAVGQGKGRGAKPQKVTQRTFRAAGYRVTVENRRGVEDGTLAAALGEILGQLRGEERVPRQGAA
jgi:ParB family chromosome partitioning protein